MTKCRKIIVLIISAFAILVFSVRLFYLNTHFQHYQEKLIPMGQTAILSGRGNLQIKSATFTKTKVSNLSPTEAKMLLGTRQRDQTFLVVQATSNYQGQMASLNLNVANQNIYQLQLPGTKRLHQKNQWQFVFVLPSKYVQSKTKLQLSLDDPKIAHQTRNVFSVHVKAVN